MIMNSLIEELDALAKEAAPTIWISEHEMPKTLVMERTEDFLLALVNAWPTLRRRLVTGQDLRDRVHSDICGSTCVSECASWDAGDKS